MFAIVEKIADNAARRAASINATRKDLAAWLIAAQDADAARHAAAHLVRSAAKRITVVADKPAAVCHAESELTIAKLSRRMPRCTVRRDYAYKGKHLSAEYDAEEDMTRVYGDTYDHRDAFGHWDACDHYERSERSWYIDGDVVDVIAFADYRWDIGARSTRVERIAKTLHADITTRRAWGDERALATATCHHYDDRCAA